ncbi:MAG: phage holin family protein [Chloroflexi bacterium]|nr:phage holin family protein [Chloroflexota bacterium]
MRTEWRQQFNWRLALVRLFVNGAAIILVALIVPGVNLVNPSLFSVALIALVIGLLNVFVKPVVQFVTLPFLFVTYGLIMIITSTVMFLLLALFLPDFISVNGLITAVIAGFLMNVFTMIMENIFGVVPPIVDSDPVDSDASVFIRE